MIAIKRNQLQFVKFLIAKGADYTFRNKQKLNCLDVAIIGNNYKIAIYLHDLKILPIKSCDEYLDLLDPREKKEIFSNEVRSGKKIFNLPLFYENLITAVDPSKTPPFLITKKQILGIVLNG